MNKYLLFLIINYILVVSSIDKKIMIDYISNSYKYINIFTKNKSSMFIKLLIFKIIFLLLFLIHPIIAFINGLKNRSIKNFLFYLKHPIALYDSNLKSYNLLSQKDEYKEGQLDIYWKLLFKHYNYPFLLESPDKNKSNIIKVLVSNNKVHSIQLEKYEIQENYIEDIYTGKKLKNNLPSTILNTIIENCISIHKKVKSKFKIIELTISVTDNDFFFLSGNSNPSLLNVKDKNYITKSKKFINFLHNPKQ